MDGDVRRLVAPKGQVLVFEDETLIAMEIEDELCRAGYTASSAPYGAPVEWTRAQAPTAAVVDLGLGDGRDGRDVIRELRAIFPSLPVVVVTAHMATAPKADLRGLGGPTARLSKPFFQGQVAECLAALMARAGQDPVILVDRRGT